MAIGEEGRRSSDSPPDSADPEASALAHLLHQLLARQLREAALERGPIPLVEPGGWRPGPAAAGAFLPGAAPLEVRARLARPESAEGLALASFGPWLPHAAELPLAGLAGFRELHFDARCPTGVRGTPPVIDFMASGPSGVVGAAVHVFDYLVLRPQRLSPAYARLDLPPELRPWAAYLRPGEESGKFRHVDAAALAKLAVGLGRIFAGRPVRLLYLFLEPEGADARPSFARHRAELRHLAEDAAGSGVPLVPMSFHELWAGWLGGSLPPTVRGIVAELRRRYAVALPEASRL